MSDVQRANLFRWKIRRGSIRDIGDMESVVKYLCRMAEFRRKTLMAIIYCNERTSREP